MDDRSTLTPCSRCVALQTELASLRHERDALRRELDQRNAAAAPFKAVIEAAIERAARKRVGSSLLQ
jgi:hypothetical protein